MSTIITKNSATSGSTPPSLIQGELAINVTDGRLFYGSGSGDVKEFGVTSSYALNALSASFASTASFITASGVYGPYGSNSVISASHAIYAETSSFSYRTSQTDVYVLNQSGANIAKGIVVRITGSNNSSDIPRIVTASYINDGNSANTLGITTTAIANGAEGYVITEGVLTGINTQAFTSGQLIYLGATGSIIGYAPTAPSHSVRLGEVIREQSNNGSIYVRIDNGYELDELHDVYINTSSLAYGDLLMRDGNNVWTNSKQLSGSYSLTGSLTATSFTGSLQGTSSWANNAITASYVLNAVSASFASTASFAQTASFVQTAQTASYVLNAQTASFVTTAQTASYVTGSIFTNANSAASASFAQTASFVRTAQTASYVLNAVSASFASTVPASGVIGLNLSQIATGSVTASVSPSQFTIVSGSTTEFTVTGTGATIGSAITDAHKVTGSLAITGSTDIAGSLTATQIGAGVAPSGSVRLDVRAQGALSTDIAFRVRNSANSSNVIDARGNGNVNIFTTLQIGDTVLGVNNEERLSIFSTYSAFGNINKGIRIGFDNYGIVRINNVLRSGYNQSDIILGGVGSGTLVENTALRLLGNNTDRSNQTISRGSMLIGDFSTLSSNIGNASLLLQTGSAPSTSVANTFSLYASASSAGNTAPHFRTENNAIVKIYQETTAVSSSVLVSNAGTTLTSTDTFDGYTIRQIVKALRNQGLLA